MSEALAFGVGEALELIGIFSDAADVGHLDWIYGPRSGPVGTSFCNNLGNQSDGHPTGVAVLEPNRPVWPQVLIVCKFTHKKKDEGKHAVQHFGPGQYAIARAIADAVAEGEIPREQCRTHVAVCGLFVHSGATNDDAIFHNNYVSARLAIRRSVADLAGQESDQGIQVMLANRESADHLFYKQSEHQEVIAKAQATVPAFVATGCDSGS